MLNSGMGGVLYAGIFDNGEVNGFMLSAYQRLHIALQVQEVTQRFQPAVPAGLVTVQFVLMKEQMDKATEGVVGEEGVVAVSPALWRLRHRVRDWHRCWCDQEAAAATMRGLLLPWYVVEVTVGRQQEQVFMAEDEGVYVRQHATTILLEGKGRECVNLS